VIIEEMSTFLELLENKKENSAFHDGEILNLLLIFT